MQITCLLLPISFSFDTRFEIHLKDAGQFSANGKDEAEFYLALNLSLLQFVLYMHHNH